MLPLERELDPRDIFDERLALLERLLFMLLERLVERLVLILLLERLLLDMFELLELLGAERRLFIALRLFLALELLRIAELLIRLVFSALEYPVRRLLVALVLLAVA